MEKLIAQQCLKAPQVSFPRSCINIPLHAPEAQPEGSQTCNVWFRAENRSRAEGAPDTSLRAFSAEYLMAPVSQTLHVWLPSTRRFAAKQVIFKQVLLVFYVCLSLCLFAPPTATAQTPSSEAQATGGVRLRVRPTKEKGLPRKRFYLIKGSAEENKALIEKINQHPFLTRECYYRRAGASEAFIKWLAEGDCESVYCRLIEEKFVSGATAVPEFRAAYERGVKEYKKPELGRLWLTTNLTDEIRDGFYRQRQAALKALISEAEILSKASVMSVMTDGKGTANFTDLLPGTYLITNLLPAEFGNNSLLWRCEVKVKAGPFKTVTVSNATDKNCVVVEKPLPACDASKQTALKR